MQTSDKTNRFLSSLMNFPCYFVSRCKGYANVHRMLAVMTEHIGRKGGGCDGTVIVILRCPGLFSFLKMWVIIDKWK